MRLLSVKTGFLGGAPVPILVIWGAQTVFAIGLSASGDSIFSCCEFVRFFANFVERFHRFAQTTQFLFQLDSDLRGVLNQIRFDGLGERLSISAS